jgi:uncharacterized protein YrrD
VADPVAWKVVERGWRVADSAGEEIGKVDEITGDPEADIFDGLTVSKGILSRARYVPSEQVAEIREGEVRLALTKEQVERLQDFKEPPAEEQIIPERSTWYQRLAWWTTGRNR